ncbi:MAG: hypothetical protein HOV80_12520, partial [Polyangiaceae bacterium]|nr:hypothetical protein [Polyangiaceae bacterium]
AARRATSFLYCGNALIAELSSGGVSRVFVHRPDSFAPLLHVEHNEVFVTVCDPVGTPLDLVDAAGRVAWSASRGAFGDVRAEYEDPMRVQSGKRVRSPFSLLGQVHDPETGLAWTRFRVFDPAIGSWLSSDPWGIEGGSTPFGFDGAPTIDTDPLGLDAVHRPGAKGPNVPPGTAVTVERTPEGLVPTSRPLSPEEAGRRLARGEDVYAGDRDTARAVAGRGAIGPETHPAEGENRFPHFHRSDREGGHVFFGSAE